MRKILISVIAGARSQDRLVQFSLCMKSYTHKPETLFRLGRFFNKSNWGRYVVMCPNLLLMVCTWYVCMCPEMHLCQNMFCQPLPLISFSLPFMVLYFYKVWHSFIYWPTTLEKLEIFIREWIHKITLFLTSSMLIPHWLITKIIIIIISYQLFIIYSIYPYHIIFTTTLLKQHSKFIKKCQELLETCTINKGIKQVEGITMPCKPMLVNPDLRPGSSLTNWAPMGLNGNNTRHKTCPGLGMYLSPKVQTRHHLLILTSSSVYYRKVIWQC